MAIINTSSYAELYSLVQIEWDNADQSIPLTARKSGIFNETSFPDGTGKFRRMSEYDFELYAHNKAEGAQSAIQKQQLGYEKDMTLVRKSINVEYTYEGSHYEKYSFNTDAIREAKSQMNRRLDLDLQHRITFGTATTYVDMDGANVDISVGDTLALFSTAHTVRASASTYRNILANNPQVSKGALEAMEKMWIENTINQFGQKVARPANKIWSTDDPNTCNTIRELLKSTAAVSAPNAGVQNVYEGKYEHVVLPLVASDAQGNPDSTKAKYWGLVATGTSAFQAYLGVNEEAHVMPLAMSNSVDVRTDNTSLPCRIGYGIVIVSGRFITLSKGNGDA
jgi:hypothetical protein